MTANVKIFSDLKSSWLLANMSEEKKCKNNNLENYKKKNTKQKNKVVQLN